MILLIEEMFEAGAKRIGILKEESVSSDPVYYAGEFYLDHPNGYDDYYPKCDRIQNPERFHSDRGVAMDAFLNIVEILTVEERKNHAAH